MSEKILIHNENEQNILLNNNYYQANDNNENSTINKCYQCILCSPMFFQRKRNLKRLWGLRVNQITSSITTATTITSSSLNQELEEEEEGGRGPHQYHQSSQQQQQQQQQQFHQMLQAQQYTQSMLHGGGCGDTFIAGTGRRSIEQSRSGSNPFLNCCGDSNGSSNDGNGPFTFNSGGGSNSNPINTTNLHQLFYALAKKLKEAQIETLCQAVKHGAAYDGQSTNCVLVPRCPIDGEDPHVIACRLWRWADLRYANELKRIPACPNEMDPIYVCCNPTHWYRICQTESPPPPYSLFAMERLKPEDRAPSENRLHDATSHSPGSFSTDGEDASSSGWCQLAYWELSQRVGRLFPVENPAVNIFAEQTRGDGLCLTTLAMQRMSVTPSAVLKARQKIGLGVTLSRESDGVWIYNRSSAPVFVHSPTLSDMDSRSVVVYRVSPGHCLRAFDHVKAAKESYAWPSTIADALSGPVDKYSVRISFAKGWGPNYHRKEVISCPCWLEVLLSPCR